LGAQLSGITGWASIHSGSPAVAYSRLCLEGFWGSSCEVEQVVLQRILHEGPAVRFTARRISSDSGPNSGSPAVWYSRSSSDGFWSPAVGYIAARTSGESGLPAIEFTWQVGPWDSGNPALGYGRLAPRYSGSPAVAYSRSGLEGFDLGVQLSEKTVWASNTSGSSAVVQKGWAHGILGAQLLKMAGWASTDQGSGRWGLEKRSCRL
jgi:hypothetical protein